MSLNVPRLLGVVTAVVMIATTLVQPPVVGAQVWVDGYYRDDGTYVEGHYRSNPDGNPYNNYSFPGNYNPNTGEISDGNPQTYLENYYDEGTDGNVGDIWVDGYYRDDGTYVEGHYRTRPDGDPTNNYSYPGNDKPSTDKTTSSNSSVLSRLTKMSKSLYENNPSRRLTPENLASVPEFVTEIQGALILLGYDPGLLNGEVGPKTRSAIRNFQRDIGAEADGVLDTLAMDRIIYKLAIKTIADAKNN